MPNQPPRQNYQFEEGTIIANRYQVVREVGCGGMGVVVQVVDRALDNDVLALKLLYPQHVRDQTVFARFRREVLLARRLSHPNITRLYDFGSAGKGYYFISMEYVDGVNLSKKIYAPPEERITFKECLRVLKRAADGVAEAHRQNVVHRDLKPDNIIVANNGDVKITDFGLARTLTSDQNLTQTGEAVGTPYYMSPEQIRGDTVDQRSDLYSLGIIGFELVAGYRPFQHDVWLNLATMHLTDPLPPISTDGNAVPSWYQDILEHATAKNREDRFQSVEDFALEIAKYLNEPEEGNSITLNTSKRRVPKKRSATGQIWLRRSIITAVSIASLILFLAVGPRVFGPAQELATRITSVVEQSQDGKSHFLRTLFGVKPEVDVADFKKALKSGDSHALNKMIEKGIDPNLSVNNIPVLFHVIESNTQATIPVLLESGANPNVALDDGTSPLILATKNGNNSAVKLLMERKADLNWRDKEGQSPLHYAALNDRSDIAKLLLEANAIADGVNHRGQTPLSIAVARNSLALARVLLLNNANPNIQDRKKDSPLHIAVRDNNLPMAKLLLAHGAAVGIRDQSNRDAFELARDLDSAKLIGLLSRKNDEGRRGNIKRRWMKNRAGQHDPAAPNNKDSTSLD